jgi:hypothetical protein
MIKEVMISLIVLVVLPIYSFAQVPGDINCSDSFNGLDITFLVNHLFFWGPPGPFMDTTYCGWPNMDMNGDGINHTVADWWQIFFGGHPIGNSPPLPAQFDTIFVQEAYASPGDTVIVPVGMKIIELFTGAFFHMAFDSSSIDILDYSENQFMSSPFGGNYYIDHERFQAFQLSDTIPQIPGRYYFGELEILVSEDVPPVTDIDLHLVSGTYYPTGFSNYSIPTYFIAPVLVDGVIHVVTTGTDEPEVPRLPEIYLSNFPNPFNASTVIEFDLRNDMPVELILYDLLGREIDRPLSSLAASGHHEVTWDGTDYPSGIYFYRLEASEGSYTRRMTLLK